jgi:hypothetical protein
MIRSQWAFMRGVRGRGLEDVDLFGLEDGLEGGGVLAVAVARQEPRRLQPYSETGGTVAGLWGGPIGGGMGGHTGDV